MTDLPAPLIDPEVDLRDFDFMPLHGERLFASDTWITCNPEEKVAALRLWWASWHQEPAGSLPKNENLLADLAGYGVAVKAFRKVTKNALRGWIECSDGRLYHPVVVEIAMESWAGKRKRDRDREVDRLRKIDHSMRDYVFSRDGMRCTYCGDKKGPFQIDHIIPVAQGGANDSENLTVSCRPCNLSKGGKTPSEWLQ